MKLLLDSHTLLWSIGKSEELSPRVIREIKNTNNQILVSAISLWEIALKHHLGKIVLGSFDIQEIPHYCKKMGFELIPLNPDEALEYDKLLQKKKHRDTFDRMLIYQRIKNKYIFVSKDGKIDSYNKAGLEYFW
ncbi:MAG: type II toxin-antitoxin system VapC family toxin [Treponema sp.]|jgi:PIN domain nuclease of toxin-antitoxin system|nr:type II toxin-antitoxin system VapC family toxin [Treponema sp.]